MAICSLLSQVWLRVFSGVAEDDFVRLKAERSQNLGNIGKFSNYGGSTGRFVQAKIENFFSLA